MPDLDATVGGATANSFASIEDADTYLDARLNADAWNVDADDDDKARALIEASRELSTLESMLQGFRTDAVQALCFPRIYVINTKAPITAPIGISGFPEYADDVIPGDWVSATIELAFEFLRAGTTDVASLNQTGAVIEETVGPITTRWASPAEGSPTPAVGLARFPRVVSLVEQFFALDRSGNTVVRS